MEIAGRTRTFFIFGFISIVLILFLQACSRSATPMDVMLSYEVLDEGGPSFKLLFHENGHYIVYQGSTNCGVPGVQIKQISEQIIRQLVSAFTDSGFFNLPRILRHDPDPWGVTLCYRDDDRIHEVVDTTHQNPTLVKLEALLRDSAKIEDYLYPTVEVYRQLVASGWDVNTEGDDRENALSYAVSRQDLESVRFLLEHGIAVTKGALQHAARVENFQILRELLSAVKSNCSSTVNSGVIREAEAALAKKK